MTLFLFPHPNTIFSSLLLIMMSINNDSYCLIIGTIGCLEPLTNMQQQESRVHILHFLSSLIGLCSVPGTLLKNDCLNESMHEWTRYQIEHEPKFVFDRVNLSYLFVTIPLVCNSDSKHLSLLIPNVLIDCCRYCVCLSVYTTIHSRNNLR